MSRRWYRSNYAKLALVSILAITGPRAGMGAPLPALLKKVETKYKSSPSLMAAFTQVNESVLLGTRKTSTGVISVKRPGKVRWETQEPDPSIFVTDGKTMWFYTPPFDKGMSGQLIVRKAAEYQSRLASALLAGNFSMGKDLKITQKTISHYLLTPKPGTAGDVLDAELFIDSQKILIEKVVLKLKGGNVSEISLSKIMLGKTLEDEMFRFSPPPQTDVVKE